MDLYIFVKALHILCSTILFGTGIGIAFFMFQSIFTKNIYEKSYAVRNTVFADYIFTLPAVVIQPLSGLALIHMGGYGWNDFWLSATYALYAIAGLCWIPVVWIQIQLKNMITESIQTDGDLPPRYYKLFRLWFLLGWPAFISLIVIFYLMVEKPT